MIFYYNFPDFDLVESGTRFTDNTTLPGSTLISSENDPQQVAWEICYTQNQNLTSYVVSKVKSDPTVKLDLTGMEWKDEGNKAYFLHVACDDGVGIDIETNFQGYNPTSSISSSSDIAIYGSFSAGEIMISFLLLLQLFIMLLAALIKSFSAIKTKKRYIEYSNADVPINEQL